MTVRPERLEGQVKRIVRDRGFLFLTGPNGDVFGHRSGGDPDLWDALEVGEVVTFIEQDGPKGLRALDIQPIGV